MYPTFACHAKICVGSLFSAFTSRGRKVKHGSDSYQETFKFYSSKLLISRVGRLNGSAWFIVGQILRRGPFSGAIFVVNVMGW